MFWEQIRCAISEDSAARFLETYADDNASPSPNDERRWPLAKRKGYNREHDAELARILSRTEILVAGFVEQCRLSQSEGQALLDLLRHPHFDLSEIRSQNIVHLIRRLERPLQESTVHTYNMWK